jgi:antitoxin YefM
MEPVSYTQLRQNLAQHLESVGQSGAPLIITRQGGKKSLVLMPLEEFEGWQETVHLLNSPANAVRLMESIRQVAEGNVVHKTMDDLDRA